MIHEPECTMFVEETKPFGEIKRPTPCECEAIHLAYKRGREDAAKDVIVSRYKNVPYPEGYDQQQKRAFTNGYAIASDYAIAAARGNGEWL